MDRLSYIILFIIIFKSLGLCQIDKDSTGLKPIDSLSIELKDSISLSPIDSLEIAKADSLKQDSINNDIFKKYKIAPDPIEGDIDWGAKGKQIYDKDSNKLKLYDDAYVNYNSISLKAGYIEFDLNKSEIIGLPLKDSLNDIPQNPLFKNKKEEFVAKKIKYNIKSKKGWVEYATKKQGELTIHGTVGKFISAEGDSINHVDKMFIGGGLITNCTNPEHPHWGIHANKIKLIPNRLAVFGRSNVEIAGVSLPLILPFGAYPMFQGQRSGLILPKKLDYDKNWGVGVRDIGVYFMLNDYMDLKLTADIYTRGSHGLKIKTNYNKRYKYSGSFGFDYFNSITLSPNDTTILRAPRFNFSLTHNQSRKANPYQKFGGNINFSLNGYQRNVNVDARSRNNNIIRSNFSYSNSLPGTPFNMSVSLNHNQNNNTRKLNLTFPKLDINMNTIYPFKKKKRVGKEKWFEKISLNYKGAAKNLINATDTTLFKKEVWDQMKYGVTQHLGTGATFRVKKYINLTFGLNYDEKHFFKTIDKHFDGTIKIDTVKDSEGIPKLDAEGNLQFDTTFGNIVIDTVSNWKIYRHLTPSLSLSTSKNKKILFKKGLIRGLKHKINYSLSFSGNPIDEEAIYGREVHTDLRPEYDKIQKYSIFDYNSAYGSSHPQRKNVVLSYGIKHIIEAKYFSKRDSSVKKLSLLRNLNISGNYNFTADSFNFSPVRVSFNFYLFKKFVSIRYSGTFDPYMKLDGKRINRYVWDEKKRPLRHDISTINVSVNNKSFDQIASLFIKKDKSKKKSQKSTVKNDRLFSLLKKFSLNYNLRMEYRYNDNNVDTFKISTHSIAIRGSLPITKNWNINIGSLDYNIKDKRFEYPSLGFSRDLHCWNMNFSWQPKNGTYSFYIGVRSSVLKFIKYNHGVDPLRANIPNSNF